mmetsp:Transcript_41628/g.134576  ORF Transcript_41628/g.134576 Transcript_41628/m.134576 type:complete len:324 (-) Transcript_41628:81-1052(-)
MISHLKLCKPKSPTSVGRCFNVSPSRFASKQLLISIRFWRPKPSKSSLMSPSSTIVSFLCFSARRSASPDAMPKGFRVRLTFHKVSLVAKTMPNALPKSSLKWFEDTSTSVRDTEASKALHSSMPMMPDRTLSLKFKYTRLRHTEIASKMGSMPSPRKQSAKLRVTNGRPLMTLARRPAACCESCDPRKSRNRSCAHPAMPRSSATDASQPSAAAPAASAEGAGAAAVAGASPLALISAFLAVPRGVRRAASSDLQRVANSASLSLREDGRQSPLAPDGTDDPRPGLDMPPAAPPRLPRSCEVLRLAPPVVDPVEPYGPKLLL